MKNIKQASRTFRIAAALIAFPAGLAAEDKGSDRSAAAGRIAYHYVGRVSLNFPDRHRHRLRIFHALGRSAGRRLAIQRNARRDHRSSSLFGRISRFNRFPQWPILAGQFAVTPILVAPGDFQSTSPPSRTTRERPRFVLERQVIATFSREPEHSPCLARFQ